MDSGFRHQRQRIAFAILKVREPDFPVGQRRNLVWLGRPANIASKLTDQANKPAVTTELHPLSVAYNYTAVGMSLTWIKEYRTSFVDQLEPTGYGGIKHKNPIPFIFM